MNNNNNNKKKLVIVTGGSSGIGRSICIKFGLSGYFPIILDIDSQGGQETLDLIKNKRNESKEEFAVTQDKYIPKEENSKNIGDFFHCDVSSWESVENTFRSVLKKYETCPQFFVNNVGIEGKRALLHEQNVEDFEKVLRVNLEGYFLCMKIEITLILEHQKQNSNIDFSKNPFSIINISSTAGSSTFPTFSPYVTSKWGINGLTKNTSSEYASFHIRINAISPATTDTPMVKRFEKQWSDLQKSINEKYPIKRIAYPEEIANIVFFVSTGDCNFMTGSIIEVSGGK